MKELTAYNVRTRKKCKIMNPQLISMKNGRKAITGIADDDRKTRVFRMISEAEARSFSNDRVSS